LKAARIWFVTASKKVGNYVVWKEFFGKKLTQSAIDLLIQGRTTRLIKGFRLEDGRVV
jgi:hypothetical protein